MPQGVALALQSAGIVPTTYPEILAHDPIAADPSALKAPRFVSTNTTFPYEPPFAAGDAATTSTYAISNSQVATVATTAEDSVKVGISASGSASYMGLLTVKIKESASWEWTNKSSNAQTTGSSQSGPQLTIGGPAFGYNGPSVIAVYYDTVYRTFAFTLLPVDPARVALRGSLLTRDGAPAASSQVALIEGTNKHLTYTNAKGEFKFLGDMKGKVTVQADDVSEIIPKLEAATIPVKLRCRQDGSPGTADRGVWPEK